MGSTSEFNPCKPHYDISMSKRTRKPMLDLEETTKDLLTRSKRSIVHQSEEEDCHTNVLNEHQEEEGDSDTGHKSFKQLIGKNEEAANGMSKSCRSSLSQHFTEERQLQLVTKQIRGVEGLKLKGMMGHCVKALSHFIKVKHRDSRSNIGSRKKPLLRLG